MAIETLNVDGNEMKVSDLSAEVQRLVAVYESTHAKRVDIENDHIMLSAALRQISSDITAAIRTTADEQPTAEEVGGE
jgi:hypothetical protein